MDKDLTKFQETKQAAEKKVKIGIGLVLLAVIAFFALGGYGIIGAVVVGLPAIVLIGIGFASFKKVSDAFKHEVLTDLVASFVDNGVFDPDRGLDMTTVYGTEFLKRADRSHTEDFLSGSMDGVEFVSSDVKLEERHVEHTKNGTRTTWETYFLGRVFVFEFNKSFDGYLQVLEGGRPVVKRKYSKVKLESVAFNKKFKTYATSEHEAFYVLTPHFMEALMTFEQNNKGRIMFSFIDSKLYIGINNFRDTFELRMFRALDESTFDEFKRELLVVQEVISELKLNNNIFKKE